MFPSSSAQSEIMMKYLMSMACFGKARDIPCPGHGTHGFNRPWTLRPWIASTPWRTASSICWPQWSGSMCFHLGTPRKWLLDVAGLKIGTHGKKYGRLEFIWCFKYVLWELNGIKCRVYGSQVVCDWAQFTHGFGPGIIHWMDLRSPGLWSAYELWDD